MRFGGERGSHAQFCSSSTRVCHVTFLTRTIGRHIVTWRARDLSIVTWSTILGILCFIAKYGIVLQPNNKPSSDLHLIAGNAMRSLNIIIIDSRSQNIYDKCELQDKNSPDPAHTVLEFMKLIISHVTGHQTSRWYLYTLQFTVAKSLIIVSLIKNVWNGWRPFSILLQF